MTKVNPKRLNAKKILQIIQPEGVLHQVLKNFEARESQQKMVQDIIDVYNNDGIALIEAGTGTGKSIAYLLPAMLWSILYSERTLISTHTISLQEQLINKDIPLLANALKLDIKAVLVKGMNNYICLRKLGDVQNERYALSMEDSKELERIEIWEKNTCDGSRSDLNFVPSFAVWDKVAAEKDACSQRECPHYKECHFFKARRKANDANILIANHHMLFADISLRAIEGKPQSPGLLPAYTRIILDEAHHIEDIATEFFAKRSSKLGILHQLVKLIGEKQGKLTTLKQAIQGHYKTEPPREISSIFTRLNVDLPAMRRNILEEIDHTYQSYEEFTRAQLSFDQENSMSESRLRILPKHLTEADWKNELVPETKKLATSLNQFIVSVQSLKKDVARLANAQLEEKLRSVFLDIESLLVRLTETYLLLCNFIEEPKPSEVRWIELQNNRSTQNVNLISAQLDVAPFLSEWLFKAHSTIVLCSATLTTNKEFTFIRKRLGITETLLKNKRVTENIYESPFNYSKQALFVIPTDMPDPIDAAFLPQAIEQIWVAIQASQGNAFVLFTSYVMLQKCYETLFSRLTQNGYIPLKQGETNRQALLTRFKSENRSVLFGTDSFWEGVDVPGDALRCVIIVKLPFKVPSDPMIEARAESILAQGGNPFLDYLLPNAIVKFKQGFGRLIRNRKDRGCIICLDSRILKKQYGKLILNSLPNCSQLFIEGAQLSTHMKEFYKKTYHLVAK